MNKFVITLIVALCLSSTLSLKIRQSLVHLQVGTTAQSFDCSSEFVRSTTESPAQIEQAGSTGANIALYEFVKYVSITVKNCIGTSGPNWETAHASGTHNVAKETGSFTYKADPSSLNYWSLEYYKGLKVGCLTYNTHEIPFAKEMEYEANGQTPPTKGSQIYTDTVCYDLTGKCFTDVFAEVRKDTNPEYIERFQVELLKSYDKSRKHNAGGGECTWVNYEGEVSERGNINWTTGKGKLVIDNPKERTHATYNIVDFKVFTTATMHLAS